MSDDRLFTGPENKGGVSPTPFAGRSARGYGSGSTTVFTNTGASAHIPIAAPYKTNTAAAPTQTPRTSSPPAQTTRQTQSGQTAGANRDSASRSARQASRTTQPSQSVRQQRTPVRSAEKTPATESTTPSKPSKTSKPQPFSRKDTAKSVSSANASDGAGTEKTAGGDGKKTSPKKKHSKGKTILTAVLAIIILLFGCGAGTVGFILKDYKSAEFSDNIYISEDKLKSSSKVTNILLMGIDTESTEASTRSDAMILMSIDSKSHKIKLTSFLRDMYITVPGHGETKLTHACSYTGGGPQLTCDSIELNFGVKIDGYAKIGYDIFRDIIDAVDGITVSEIDSTESKALAEAGVNIEPGTNIHLDSTQALAYCRIRNGQSDFQRTERQREVIMLIMSKMVRTNPFKLIKLAHSIASKISCSVPKSKLIGLALKALPCLLRSPEQTQIPADDTWEYGTRDGMSVVLVNLEKNKNFLSEWIYGE